MRLVVDADDLDLDVLADLQDLGRVVDAPPGHVGDMQQAVDAAEVDERTVVGDVLDDAVDDLAFGQVVDDLERCSARLSSSTARRETTMLPRRRSIFRIWKGCGTFISGPTSRTGRMSTWLRGRKATAPSRSTVKPPLTWLKITPSTRSSSRTPLELDPALFAAGLVARDDRFAERVLDAVEIDFDLVADRVPSRPAGEFLERDAAFGLEADVDDGHVLFDRDDGALDDRPSNASSAP